jgi:ABC-2 type transport system permease protein
MRRILLPAATLWQREIVRFLRQPSRVIGALGQPVAFWLLLGGGLNASFRPPGAPEGTGYLEYFYPGIIALIVLFTAIFATISVVDDRRGGFIQGVLVAPVARSAIVLGQALGGTTLALLQGALLLLLAPLLGIALSTAAVLATMGVIVLLGFALTSLGLLIAWRMDSTQGFHAIMNVILIPIWLLSGAFFPVAGAPRWLDWIMTLNPLTYGVAALRRMLYLGDASHAAMVQGLPPLGVSLALTVAFGAAAFAAATWVAERDAL